MINKSQIAELLATFSKSESGTFNLSDSEWDQLLSILPYQKHDITYGEMVSFFYQWLVNECIDFTAAKVHGVHINKSNLLQVATAATGDDPGVKFVICADKDRYPNELTIAYGAVANRGYNFQPADTLYIDTHHFKTEFTSGNSFTTILKSLHNHRLTGNAPVTALSNWNTILTKANHFRNHQRCKLFGSSTDSEINEDYGSFFQKQELLAFLNSRLSDRLCLFFGFDESAEVNRARVILGHIINHGVFPNDSQLSWSPSTQTYFLERTYP